MTTLTNEARGTSSTDGRTTYLTPPANIRETEEGYILTAEMPGVGKEGLDVTVENHGLVITGRRSGAPIPGDAIYRESRGFDFRRVFDLDPSIDTAKISARMEQGILTLTLPKAETVKPKKITVTD